MMKFKSAKSANFQLSLSKCQSSVASCNNKEQQQPQTATNQNSSSADIDMRSEKHQKAPTYLCAANLESQSKRQQQPNYPASSDKASGARDACIDGLAGLFVPIKTDFTIVGKSSSPNSNHEEFVASGNNIKSKGRHFGEKPQWSRTRKRKIQKVRFIICFMGLLGLSLSQMSRMILNVGIADMTNKPVTVLANASASEQNATAAHAQLACQDHQESTKVDNESTMTTTVASILADEEAVSTVTTIDDTTTGVSPLDVEEHGTTAPPVESSSDNNNDNASLTLTTQSPPSAHPQEADPDAPTRFDWSNSQKNLLISSFYMGYAPCMLFGGSLADNYGAKYLLFVSVFGSSIVNMLTPSIASYSFTLLIVSRVVLGLLQGGLVPACYVLFSKWLTLTEASIFAPMIKVSLALGSFSGSLLPGVVAFLGYQWTCLFYIASLLCGMWSLFWYPLATSTPQSNPFVRPKELHRIMRKKQPPTTSFGPTSVSVIGNGNNFKDEFRRRDCPEENQDACKMSGEKSSHHQHQHHRVNNDKLEHLREPQAQRAKANSSTPWLLILTNPSVLALALVKITYNIGMDFFGLELAIYMQQVHNAPTETISAIASGGCIIQMSLITLVAWLAGDVVRKSKFGLSRTKWRKVFQGLSNFSMALIYFALPLAGDNLTMITVLVVLVFFFWIFAAGGESMVPYDMSTKYPATIVGVTHSLSILSGLGVPLICSLVLGDDSTNPARWNFLFMIVGAGLAIGGIVFTLVLKAKPFLPGEIVPKLPTNKRKKINSERQDVKLVVDSNSSDPQQQQQQILHDHQHRH